MVESRLEPKYLCLCASLTHSSARLIMRKGFALFFEKFLSDSYKNGSNPQPMELKKWVSIACNKL